MQPREVKVILVQFPDGRWPFPPGGKAGQGRRRGWCVNNERVPLLTSPSTLELGHTCVHSVWFSGMTAQNAKPKPRSLESSNLKSLRGAARALQTEPARPPWKVTPHRPPIERSSQPSRRPVPQKPCGGQGSWTLPPPGDTLPKAQSISPHHRH